MVDTNMEIEITKQQWDESRREKFTEELRVLINRFSVENGSDTPDFILADYLVGCLDAFEALMRNRKLWYTGYTHADDAPMPAHPMLNRTDG